MLQLKNSNELLSHAYSKLYNIPSTELRFFTVYGPTGYPDMAYFSFTNKLLKGETIQIFNNGNCKHDFIYVDDIVEGVKCVTQEYPERKIGENGLLIPLHVVYNISNNQPKNLLDFVVTMQSGDVPITYVDTNALERDFGFDSNLSLKTGLLQLVK